MAKTCNNCGTNELNVSVPYVVHEAEVGRQERQIKRMWIALIGLIGLFFVSNMAWLIYESQFETISYDYTQDGEGTNIIGDSNEVNNGAEIESENQTQEKE